MSDKTLKQVVEENVVVWLLATLATGFAAGFSAYKVVQEVGGQTSIPKSQIESRDGKIAELTSALNSIRSEANTCASQLRDAVANVTCPAPRATTRIDNSTAGSNSPIISTVR